MAKKLPDGPPTHAIQAGFGFDDTSGAIPRFERAKTDIPVRVSDEYAKPGRQIVYTVEGRRLHVDRRSLKETMAHAALAAKASGHPEQVGKTNDGRSNWDESKHPRQPMGTPKGGEFRNK